MNQDRSPLKHDMILAVDPAQLPAKREHFVVLDALRGVAAVSVAIYHACIIFAGTQLLPKAFLAVDFFFLLSGVVVAHAYEQRLTQGRIREYFERRAIRLYPMILIGAALGMSVFFTSPAARSLQIGTLVYLGLFAALCLPILRANLYPGSHSIAPMNLPSWSLFFEIFVNVVYGFVARRLTTAYLVAVAITAFFVEAFAIFKFNGVSFGIYVEDFPWGFGRVIFPFCTGVLINRMFVARITSKSAVSPLLLASGLVATFCIPTTGIGNALSELAAVAIIYPCIIVLAMRVVVSSGQDRFLGWLGAISYPLYAIHVPLFMWLSRVQRVTAAGFHVPPNMWIGLAVAVGIVCAWAAYKLYDLPLRETLTGVMKRRARVLAVVSGA